MREFDYIEARSVAEASRMLAELGERARAVAGGTALILGLRQRMLAPERLVSLAALAPLRGIAWDAQQGLRLGALTRHAEIAQSPLVRTHLPMLASMAGRVANPQVRNQGTLGGNLCYGDPSTDPPGCLMALDARVRLASARGERWLSVEEFLVDYFVTALAPDELVVEVRVPPLAPDATGLYCRHLRTAAEHRPLASVALVARRAGALCHTARLVVGASVPVPARMRRAEAHLAGKTVTAALAREAAALVMDELQPLSDARGSADYRRDVVGVVARRAIEELFGLHVQGDPA